MNADLVNEVFTPNVCKVCPLLWVCQICTDPTRHSENKGTVTHIEPIPASDKFAISVSCKRIVRIGPEVGPVELGHA